MSVTGLDEQATSHYGMLKWPYSAVATHKFVPGGRQYQKGSKFPERQLPVVPWGLLRSTVVYCIRLPVEIGPVRPR